MLCVLRVIYSTKKIYLKSSTLGCDYGGSRPINKYSGISGVNPLNLLSLLDYYK